MEIRGEYVSGSDGVRRGVPWPTIQARAEKAGFDEFHHGTLNVKPDAPLEAVLERVDDLPCDVFDDRHPEKGALRYWPALLSFPSADDLRECVLVRLELSTTPYLEVMGPTFDVALGDRVALIVCPGLDGPGE